MEAVVKFFGYIFVGALFVAALVFFSFLLAYPTMWLVNYLFASTFLTFVFGGSITVYKAWALNVLFSSSVAKAATSNSKS